MTLDEFFGYKKIVRDTCNSNYNTFPNPTLDAIKLLTVDDLKAMGLSQSVAESEHSKIAAMCTYKVALNTVHDVLV